MACKSNAQRQKDFRERQKIIKTYHIHQKMPFETDDEFKKRMSKRIVVVTDMEVVILGPFGKILDIKDNVTL